MQLLMVNFLVMFDVVFIFFLFLIAVTCVMNYMPGRKSIEVSEEEVDSDVIPPPPLFAGDDDEAAMNGRDTYVVIPPVENLKTKVNCSIHVV